MKNLRDSETLDNIPDDVQRWIPAAKKYSKETGVPVEIIMSVIWVESAGDPDAVGSAGEKGLMQLKQIAADDVTQSLEVDTSEYDLDPFENVKTGSYFLKLMKQRAKTWPEAIRAYNQGLAGSRREPGLTLSKEYWQKVKEKLEIFD